MTSSRLGMGSAAFHWTDRRRVVDTVYLGCYRTDLLRQLGGWDETTVQWAAEDQELNFRIRLAGGTIVCDPTIRSWYFPRETPRTLWRQYRNYGMCKVSTLQKHRRLPTLRPLAPAALVGSTAAALVLALTQRRVRWLFPTISWLVLVGSGGAALAREPGVDAGRAAAAVGICHWSYGVGFWAGVGRWLRGKSWDTSPTGHR